MIYFVLTTFEQAPLTSWSVLMIHQRFREAFLNAVDFAFRSLGESCQQALYFHLETTFHIERSKIPNKVEEFDNALKSIFNNGAIFLERLILQKLCRELKFKYKEKSGFDFVKAVSKVRSMALEKESLVTALDFREEVIHVKRKRGGGKFASESSHTCC